MSFGSFILFLKSRSYIFNIIFTLTIPDTSDLVSTALSILASVPYAGTDLSYGDVTFGVDDLVDTTVDVRMLGRLLLEEELSESDYDALTADLGEIYERVYALMRVQYAIEVVLQEEVFFTRYVILFSVFQYVFLYTLILPYETLGFSFF